MRGFLLALTIVLAAAPAEAARRHAIVIGANVGGPTHEPLRYAETDAARMAAVLRDVAGFTAGDVMLVTQADAAAVRHALIELNARIREESGPTMLFVYYSGHGDARSLHLYGTQLDLAELRNLVASSPARTRVLIVDSCQSGAITRVKGGTPAPEFDVVFQRSDAEGLAILTSSSASENAQESDELGASIFTHHLVSALLGAADRDGDGLVTLGEAFRYSAERTLAVSSSTRVGPQHPTYRFDLGGRDDLVLSRPASARNMGVLTLHSDGVWVVRDAGPRRAVVAEVVADAPGARIALRPGRYAILRRGKDHLLEGEVDVPNGKTVSVATNELRRIDYAQAVRKGGTERKLSLSLVAMGGMRAPILDLGDAFGGGIGLRFDFPILSVEGRLHFLTSRHENDRVEIGTDEFAASALVTHSFDWGPLALGGGVELGGVRMHQSFQPRGGTPRTSYGLLVGPVAFLEWLLGGRFGLRIEGALGTYLLRGEEGMQTPFAPRVMAGIGASL